MYSLWRHGMTAQNLRSQAPSLGITLAVAEAFYRFHSFTLEFLAALATWAVVDLVISRLLSWTARPVRIPRIR